ncbi:hypothetical protein J6590_047898 [Homalodisca vitripennis]|nr:hypothetical protein J6590_047898 [Homalodisca vitripennis]
MAIVSSTSPEYKTAVKHLQCKVVTKNNQGKSSLKFKARQLCGFWIVKVQQKTAKTERVGDRAAVTELVAAEILPGVIVLEL